VSIFKRIRERSKRKRYDLFALESELRAEECEAQAIGCAAAEELQEQFYRREVARHRAMAKFWRSLVP